MLQNFDGLSTLTHMGIFFFFLICFHAAFYKAANMLQLLLIEKLHYTHSCRL